jgi:hypothetical protein
MLSVEMSAMVKKKHAQNQVLFDPFIYRPADDPTIVHCGTGGAGKSSVMTSAARRANDFITFGIQGSIFNHSHPLGQVVR